MLVSCEKSKYNDWFSGKVTVLLSLQVIDQRYVLALCGKAVAHQGDVILRRWCAYDVILETGQPVNIREYHQPSYF